MSTDQAALDRAARSATDRSERLVARYNTEYRAGKWSTNRPLASACENAYSAMVAARVAAGWHPDPCPCGSDHERVRTDCCDTRFGRWECETQSDMESGIRACLPGSGCHA